MTIFGVYTQRVPVWRITPQTTDADCKSVVYLDRTVVPMIGESTQLVGMMYCRVEPGWLHTGVGLEPVFKPDPATMADTTGQYRGMGLRRVVAGTAWDTEVTPQSVPTGMAWDPAFEPPKDAA